MATITDAINKECIEWKAAKDSNHIDQIIAWLKLYHKDEIYSFFKKVHGQRLESKGGNWEEMGVENKKTLIEYGDDLCSERGRFEKEFKIKGAK